MENQGPEHDAWGDLDLGFGVQNFGSYGSRSGGDSVACFVDVDEYLVAVTFCSFFPAVEVGWGRHQVGEGLLEGRWLGKWSGCGVFCQWWWSFVGGALEGGSVKWGEGLGLLWGFSGAGEGD